MAVKIMQKNYVFLEKLGVPADILGKLQASKIVLHLGFKEVKFVSPSGNVVGHVVFPVSVASLMKPECAASTKQVVLGQVGKTLSGMILSGVLDGSKPAETPNLTVPAGMLPPDVQATPEMIQKVMEASVKAHITTQAPTPPQAKVEPPLTKAQINAMDAVKLSTAKRMYQPVFGTTKGKRYYVVALGPDAAMAVHLTPSNVDMRAERATPAARKVLVSLGFTDNGDYLSTHHKVVKTTPTRLVGAVLMATGLEWNTPLPNLSVLP